ncbi:ketopantoate reductase family protein [bacterium LRH843]|nr:ketopantoate reductase family protein [bacterium LRH843]
MKKINTVTLIGLGAVGAAYGTKLQEGLQDSFRVVANPERIQRYENNPLQVNGKEYRFNYIIPETKTEPADLVIFAVKNAELAEAMKDLTYHIGPDTIILSLLNGISSEEEIFNKYGNHHILHSMTVGIDAVRENNQITFASLGKIYFGEKDQSLSNDALAVKELFERVGIDYEIPENMWRTLWWKFMMNVGVNQVSAILRAPYGTFHKVPSALELVESAMYEVVALSEKTGVFLNEDDIKKVRSTIYALAPGGKTSMLQDVEAGRKTEVEYFGGTVCTLGKQHQVPTPFNEYLCRMIQAIEETARLESELVNYK